MEGIKISELEELSSVTGNEYIPVVDSNGANKKVKTGGIVTVDSELSNTSKNPLQNKVISNKFADVDRLQKKTLHKANTSLFMSKEDAFYYNLYNPDDEDVKVGYFINYEGNLSQNSNYTTSGYIPFSREMGILTSSVNGRENIGGGFIAYCDSAKNIIKMEGLSSCGGKATWFDGVYYVRFSLNDPRQVGNYQIEVGDTITPYLPYGTFKIKSEYLNDLSNFQLNSILGQEANRKQIESISDNNIYRLEDYPYHIKKGICLSFYADINTFNTIYIGKGYNQYRGDWLKIDTTNITLQYYESATSDVEQAPHGLNISSFIKVIMSGDDYGRLSVIVQSMGGYYKHTFEGFGYEANWAPFVKSDGQILSNVKICCTNKDFRHPVWAFGDSYFGFLETRWPYHMKDFGFLNFLINGIAGQGSAAAYADLLRTLNFGTPKYLLWCLGMNDSDSTFKTNFDLVKSVCDKKNITLIAATIPTVPSRDKENITQYVKDSGVRYIDFYKAVGANSLGEWYDGYLYSDGVHPTELGAKSLATQVLVDFPELMQYGVI